MSFSATITDVVDPLAGILRKHMRYPMVQDNKIGVILANIGSPASTSVPDVRTYLGNFLGDDRVLDIKPWFLKWIILKIILLTRPAESAEAYSSIWDEKRGSPLVYLTEDLVEKLQRNMGDSYEVVIGMMYSPPFMQDAIKNFRAKGINRIAVVPMYPQSASSTTGSTLQMAYECAKDIYAVPYIYPIPPFYRDEGFINAWKNTISEHIGPADDRKVDHLLISFHGLPERHCTRTHMDPKMTCKEAECDHAVKDHNAECYRAQCFETARLIAEALELPEDFWEVSFQSRLTLRDTIKWVEPYTDRRLEALGAAGVKRLAICAPSFAIDCIETFEELGMQGEESFTENGGEELVLIPCINARDDWAKSLEKIIKQNLPFPPPTPSAE